MNKSGEWAERQAAKFLKQQGLKIVDTNYAVTGGEVDIIARDADVLVFVEVRYRKSDTFGTACETIDAKKQQRIIKATTKYLQQHKLWDKIACRFDTVCIMANNNQGSESSLTWEQDAFGL